MRLIIRCWLVSALLTLLATAQQLAPVNDPISAAVDHIYNLEYDDAIDSLDVFLKADPNNLKALNRLADAMLRKEMFRQGLMEVGVYGDKGDVFKPTKSVPDPQFDAALAKVLDTAQGVADARLAITSPDGLLNFVNGGSPRDQSTQADLEWNIPPSACAAIFTLTYLAIA